MPVPVAYDVRGALEVLPIGQTKLRELIRDGEIPSIRIGRRLLIPAAGLDAYVNRLAESA